MMRSARGWRSSLVIGPYTSSIPDHTRWAVCVYTCVDRHIHYTCVEGSVRKSRECKSVDKEAPVANIYIRWNSPLWPLQRAHQVLLSRFAPHPMLHAQDCTVQLNVRIVRISNLLYSVWGRQVTESRLTVQWWGLFWSGRLRGGRAAKGNKNQNTHLKRCRLESPDFANYFEFCTKS